jgi:RHS repeat-associated protein
MAKELTKKPINVNAVNAPSNTKVYTFTRGEKFFELSNHLGNVLAVIADKKLPVASIGGMAINYWQADVVTATGYYPFGMPMPARTGKTYNGTWVPGRGFTDGGLYPTDLSVAQRYAPRPANYVATRQIELLPGFETGLMDEMIAEILNPTDNPNGSTGMYGGEGSYEAYGYYRYGFNGKENDNEVKGAGNQQDYGMRIYDPRLGRFLSVDPITKQYPELTPYQFASNCPIAMDDIDGLEGRLKIKDFLIPIGLPILGPPVLLLDEKRQNGFITQGKDLIHGLKNLPEILDKYGSTFTLSTPGHSYVKQQLQKR